jgi:hypothetical protein
LVLAALLFWQGGFTFYAAIVVPIGQGLFGDEMQGSVTRHVTNYLNLSGAVALLVLAWDAAASADHSALRRRARWLAWVGMVVVLALLVWLHANMDGLLDADSFNRNAFRNRHRWYLWLSTVQWACGLAYMGLTIGVWRCGDQLMGAKSAMPESETLS